MYAQRRKKKRSSNRIYRIDLERGSNGFGFSISGEKPCTFSCVSKTSPVFGLLKQGDYLIAVKDLEIDGPEINVSKMPHDQIVDIISNAKGHLRLTVAGSHYFNNSSDEENDFYMGKYHLKPGRMYHRPYPRAIPNTGYHHHSRHVHDFTRASCSKENIDGASNDFLFSDPFNPLTNHRKMLEFKIVVGYLGTIEMPKQIASSSKHTTVKSCIRKLRQDKRTPSLVTMTILPTSLTLTNTENVVLANYPAIRLNYVNSENNSKYFGLVTSAIYSNGMMCDTVEVIPPSNDISVSNSCHVFVVDKNITEHTTHYDIATQFKIECTRDQVTGYCLEFPTNAEYVVSLIKSMYYTKKEEKEGQDSINVRNLSVQFRPRHEELMENRVREENNRQSPHLSNETTTSSSNSDSGIGFHNDCTNISDRIVVVDFPHRTQNFLANTHKHTSRPIGIIHEVPNNENVSEMSLHASNPIYETIYPSSMPMFQERAIDVPEHILDYTRDAIMKHKISVTQSCDDLSMPNNDNLKSDQYRAMQMSADNIVDIALSSRGKSEFLVPQKPVKKVKKSLTLPNKKQNNGDQSMKLVEQSEKLSSYKLSPKVFGLPRPISMSFENLSSGLWGKKALNFDQMSSSVQDLTEGHEGGFKDGTISEPDLMGYHENQPYENKSPFHRKNQASFRSLSDFPRAVLGNNDKSTTLSSSESSVCKISTESINSYSSRGPSDWANSFEKLLEDREGIHVFAEFLKKEISAENIYFWAACERYRHMNELERLTEAPKIFDKYLGPNASDPVNVDSKARTTTKERLDSADLDLFDSARKQIFNLMKFDSYSRFLKSDLYKSCLESSESGSYKKHKRQFDNYDPLLNLSPNNKNLSSTKIKKSYSNAEDRRRTSLLPWSRKNRSQSKDRLKEPTNKKDLKDQNKFLSLSKGSVNDMPTQFDNSCNFNAMLEDRPSNLCRIVLPDGANSISQVRDEPIRSYVNKILEKRGIVYKTFEVFYFDKKSTPLDLSASAITLAHQQIKVEQRVLFKLDLPNKKVISVKSKANKLLSDVLEPIMKKYNYKIEEVQAFVKEQGQKPLDTSQFVTAVEDKRVLILYKNCDDLKHLQKSDKSNTLDEITNKVFNEVLQGKIDSESIQASTQSEDFYSEASSTRHRNFLPHIPLKTSMKPIPKEECDKEENSVETETNTKKPLIAKLKAGVKLQQTPETKAQELLAEIKKAQRARLEDQRGTEITIPLPEFLLKDKENVKKPEPAPRLSLSEGHNVFTKVQNFESGMNPNASSSHHKTNKSFDEDEIAFIDSNIGDTTLVFHHAGASHLRASSSEPLPYKKFHNSPPPLPPKPKARHSSESSPTTTLSADQPYFANSFPSGTFI